jgi:xylose isomerase
MKVGIVSIGNDSLELFRFLHRYDHKYVVYYNADARPLGDKTRDRYQAIVQEGVDFLTDQKVDTIIVPPLYELDTRDKRAS